MKFKHTSKALGRVGKNIVKGLREELKAQKHNASRKLTNGIRSVSGKNGILNIISNVSYWKAVNNPKFAKKANGDEILRWVNSKEEIPVSAVSRILKKLKNKGYGKPYVYWTEGNALRRTDFAGHTARKVKGKVATDLALPIGKDIAEMLSKEIRKNNPKRKVSIT